MITNLFVTCQECNDPLPHDLICANCALIRMERSRERERKLFAPSWTDRGEPHIDDSVLTRALSRKAHRHADFQHGQPDEVVEDAAFERLIANIDRKKGRTK